MEFIALLPSVLLFEQWEVNSIFHLLMPLVLVKIVFVHIMKAYSGVQNYISTRDNVELNEKLPVSVTYPRGKKTQIAIIRGWVAPRRGLNSLDKRKCFRCFWDSNPSL